MIAWPSLVDEGGLAAYLAAHEPAAPNGHAFRLSWVARLFLIRAEVLLAQEIHETGHFLFPGCGTSTFSGCPQFFNYCGLKNRDGSAIAAFASPDLGVIAQAAHLADYAYTGHMTPLCSSAFDPRHRDPHRANVLTVEDLGGPGRWAPSLSYGLAVARNVEAIIEFDTARKRMFHV